MSRFECNKKESCKKCGDCCHIREKSFLDSKTDLELRKKIFRKTGIVYLEPLWHYTVSLCEEEAAILRKRAKEKKIGLIIKPKKVSLKKKSIVIQDYYIDHDICPFMKENLCTIYEDRPKVCRDFPKRDLEINAKLVNEIELSGMKFEEALVFAERKLKTIKNINKL